MDFVSPLIEPIVSLVFEPLKRHIGYLVKARTNVQNMTKYLEELRTCRDDLQKDIEDAERQQLQSTKQVEQWLNNVTEVEPQVNETKNNYENRGCCLFEDSSLNCWLTYKYGKKASKLYMEMVQLVTQRNAFRTIARVQSPGHGQTIPIESTLLGLDRYVEMVRNHLIDDNVGVIGIHGMGGVGKTTLLTKVNNSLMEGERLGFEYLIWVVISKEFQLKNLQAKVAKSLGLKLNDNSDANEHARIIFQYLKDKSFLLLLDDVWKWVKLVDVGIPDTRRNTISNNQTRRLQKVILTTRLEKVCVEMGANKIIKVECLKREDAKALFVKTLGDRNLESNLRLHGLVDEVVDECAGLPLAITVIARAMAVKKTIPEWQVAVRALKRSHADEILDDDSIGMFHTLKFSYDSLKSDALRMCFLYCSLWPEDYNIFELNLIAFCIETELIKNFDSMSEAYDKGHCLIEDLKEACLLEDGSEDFCVKMHDVMRDLAIWIGSDYGMNQNKWLVKSGIGLRKTSVEAWKWKEAHVVSLIDNHIEDLSFVPSECPSLSFLLLHDNDALLKIHPNFFQNMCALTYLDLSHTRIYELPESITMLTRLRCLNLEGTDNLGYIPSGMISSLQELQILNIFNSAIRIFLEDCIGDAENNNDDGDASRDSRMSRREKSLLEELAECVAEGGLKGLSISVHSAYAFQRLSMLSHTVSIWRLGLVILQGVLTIQLQHNIWRSLQRLDLRYCDGVGAVEFVVDAERKSETSCPIEQLQIWELRTLKEILWMRVAPSVFFHMLREVDIRGCHGLKSISWVLDLPSLVSLKLWYCNGLEWLIDEEEEEQDRTAVTFPTLKRLELEFLPNLSHICGPQYGLPALQHLEVGGCPKLKKFPFPSNNKLKSIECSKQWWEGLEWDDDEGIKASMESIVTFF